MEANLSRRTLLRSTTSVAAVMAAGGVVGCTTTQATSLTGTVIDVIQGAVAVTCNFIPNVATILAILSEFPMLSGATTIADTVLAGVKTLLCSAYTNGGGAPAVASGKKLQGKLKSGNLFEVHGYHIGPSGTLVAF